MKKEDFYSAQMLVIGSDGLLPHPFSTIFHERGKVDGQHGDIANQKEVSNDYR